MLQTVIRSGAGQKPRKVVQLPTARIGRRKVLWTKKVGRSIEKITKNEMTSRKLSKKEIARIKVLHKKGMSERAIAEKIGCSRSTVWYWLQK